MAITESAITLNFPDQNYFRFQDCEGYKSIQNHFKEMDACWYDSSADVIYMIELKDWTVADLTSTPYTEQRIWDLVKKSVDSVNMIACVQLERPYASQLTACMPFSINRGTSIKLISIVHCKTEDQPMVSAINQAYRQRFKSYANLFDVKAYSVITHDQAMARFNWIA